MNFEDLDDLRLRKAGWQLVTGDLTAAIERPVGSLQRALSENFVHWLGYSDFKQDLHMCQIITY